MQSPLVASMVEAARASAGVLLAYYEHPDTLRVTEKGRADLVSQADVEAEAAIFRVLERTDPGARFEGEETVAGRATSGRRYIVDPLDGTANFLRGIPHFCVSIAHADEAGVTAGVVLDPVRNELFWAERGQGAYFGERRLERGPETPQNVLVHTGMPPLEAAAQAHFLGQLKRVIGRVSFFRRMGSAALDLAYVAAGRGDAFFEMKLKPWDIAAGLLLVREAGGIVTDHQGGDGMLVSGDILAAIAPVHARLLDALRDD